MYLYSYGKCDASVLYHFQDIASYSSKVSYFNLPQWHLVPKLGVTQFEFRQYLWYQKTRVPGVFCHVVSMILRLSLLTQYRHVTNRWTDTHIMTANTELAWRRAVKTKLQCIDNR